MSRGKTLWLIQTRARQGYECGSCGQYIASRTPYFRHDPHPFARQFRGEHPKQFCVSCVLRLNLPKEIATGRIRVQANLLASGQVTPLIGSVPVSLIKAPLVSVVDVGQQLAERIANDPAHLHELRPAELVELACNRLDKMGLRPQKTRPHVNVPDGGIDIVFSSSGPFPVLGAVQVKSHRAGRKEGPQTVREFAGVLENTPFQAGIIVTNTRFTQTALWEAQKRLGRIRLRGFDDLVRWVGDEFDSEQELREIPQTLALAPGFIIRLRE